MVRQHDGVLHRRVREQRLRYYKQDCPGRPCEEVEN